MTIIGCISLFFAIIEGFNYGAFVPALGISGDGRVSYLFTATHYLLSLLIIGVGEILYHFRTAQINKEKKNNENTNNQNQNNNTQNNIDNGGKNDEDKNI